MGADCPCHLETRSKTVHAESCIQGDGVPAQFMHTDIATYTEIVSLLIGKWMFILPLLGIGV